MPFIEPKNPSVMALRGLHLYLAGVSNCSMGVRMRLEEEGLSWESLHLDLLKEESITEEYFGIKPHGLVHDGRVMIESDDIIEYLDQAFPTPCAAAAKRWGIAADVGLVATGHPHSPQSGPNAHLRKRVRGNMQQTAQAKQHYETLQTNPSLLEFHRKSSVNSFTQAELDEAKAILVQRFADLDAALKGRDWLVGDRFTLADIAWLLLQFTLSMLVGYPFDGLPNVQAWAQRIAMRPSFQLRRARLMAINAGASAQVGPTAIALAAPATV